MAGEVYANNATAVLAADTNTSTGSILVGDTSKFVPSGGTFRCAIDNEIVLATVVDATHLNLTARGQEGTTAAVHVTGATVANVITAAGLFSIIAPLLYLQTGSTPATPSTGLLALFAATGGLPKAVNDGGYLYLLGQKPGVSKSANESVSASTVTQNDDELLWTAGAAESGTFLLVLQVSSGATSAPDFKFEFTGPTGASVVFGYAAYQIGSTAITTLQIEGGKAIGSVPGVGVIASLTSMVLITGTWKTTTTPGTFNLKWAQVVSDPTAVSVLAGSGLSVWRNT